MAGPHIDRQDRLRRSWKTADYDQAKAEAAHLPQPGQLETPEEIDSYTETLTKELTRIADLVAPLRHSKGRGKAWWNHDTKRAIEEERRAQRARLAPPQRYLEAFEQ